MAVNSNAIEVKANPKEENYENDDDNAYEKLKLNKMLFLYCQPPSPSRETGS